VKPRFNISFQCDYCKLVMPKTDGNDVFIQMRDWALEHLEECPGELEKI